MKEKCEMDVFIDDRKVEMKLYIGKIQRGHWYKRNELEKLWKV